MGGEVRPLSRTSPVLRELLPDRSVSRITPTTGPRAQVLCQSSLLGGPSLPPLGLSHLAGQMVAILNPWLPIAQPDPT